MMLNRRKLLAGAAGSLAASALPLAGIAQAGRRIDVHSHIAPPPWIGRLASLGQAAAPLANWNVGDYVAELDRAGIARAITSITAPGLAARNERAAATMARACNEYAASLAADYPGRFGSFAVLPVPDIDASLLELEYALDELNADGVLLYTNYGDRWLGDPAFDPLFEELNRRNAIVYTHPRSANCCVNLLPGITDAAIEFGTDTTRTITRYVFSGSAARYPNVKMIFSHAGGTMPFLIGRFDLLSQSPANREAAPTGFRSHALQFHYDIAQSTDPITLTALKSLIPTSQIVFGTDYPFRTCVEHVEGLHGAGVFTPEEIAAIEYENCRAIGL